MPATLEIDGSAATSIELLAVAGDRTVPIATLAGARRHALAVLPGAYVVRAATASGPVAMPAPVLDAILPPDRTLRLAVEPPPQAIDAEFAFVPGGPALLGDALGVGQEDERPPRLVAVGPFWLARRECTNADYAAFLSAVDPAVDEAWCAFDSRKCRLRRDTATGRWSTDAPDLPMVTVSLAGAEAYCAWRTRATGRRHRLPSEVEWEKAARGPESFEFAYGNVNRQAAANQESGALQAVGSHRANGYGLFDLCGNAFEWTADAYHPGPAGGGPAPDRHGDPTAQVLRGGSFVLDGMYLRNSFRMWQRPDVRTDDFGFRVARDVEPDRTETRR
ncbi:MAG: formylglycine-generating enzyme family protein [Planctomycetota bacterium]